MAFTVPTKFTAIDKVSGKLSRMESSVTSFAKKAEVGIARAERQFRKLTPSIGKAGKEFISMAKAAIGIGAIVLFAKSSVRALTDYETALASAQAITGTTDKEFALFRKEINLVARETKKSSVDVAKGFEIVGSAKPELLKSAEALGAVTKASIVLSKASRQDLESSALSLTGVMNQFNLQADQSARTINVLAAGSKVGAANIPRISEAMKNFGAVAAGANLSLEESVALIEVAGKFSLFGAEAGTKLRGSVLKLQKANLGYASGQFNVNDALVEANKKMANLGTEAKRNQFLIKTFGAENVTMGSILLKNIDLFNEYTKGVTGTNVANEQAEINTRTLSVAVDELRNRWINMLTNSNKAGSGLENVRKIVVFLTNNLDTLVTIGASVLGFFTAYKILLIASKAILTIYNVILGINTALTKKNALSLRGNTVALAAYKVVAAIASGVNFVLASSVFAVLAPILLVIAAIIGIILVIKNWSKITAFFKNVWAGLVKFIQEFDFVGFFRKIGAAIISFMLAPLKSVLFLVSKIPGRVGNAAESALDKIKDIEMKVAGTSENGEGEQGGPVNVGATAESAKIERSERLEKQNVNININDKTGAAQVETDNNIAPVKTTSTLGAFG